MLSLVTHWARVDDAELGRPKLSGQEAANPLAVPMMLLYVIDEVCRDDEELRQTYCEDEEWAVQQILKHLQVNRTLTQMSLWLVTQSFPGTKKDLPDEPSGRLRVTTLSSFLCSRPIFLDDGFSSRSEGVPNRAHIILGEGAARPSV